MKNDYGVVGGIREGIKIGFLYMKDIACLAAVIGSTMLLNNLFPAGQSLQSFLFLATGIILAVYLDLHPHSNPGKRNYEVIWQLIINRQPRRFKSFGYYEFKPLQEVREENKRDGD